MDRVKALELIERPEYCGGLTMDGLYKLMLRAGFDKEDAHEASLQRGGERLNAGEMA